MDATARLAHRDAMNPLARDLDSRRGFLRRVASAMLALAGLSLLPLEIAGAAERPRAARLASGTHPTPRAGIDASKVLTRAKLTEHPAAEPVFDMVRKIPQIVDGIRCQCGCAELPEFYSLLSCYEADGMAQHCAICQGEASLAYRMHQQGKSLDQIRAAIDAKFGQ